MSVAVRLAVFCVALILVFAVAVLVGRAVAPMHPASTAADHEVAR